MVILLKKINIFAIICSLLLHIVIVLLALTVIDDRVIKHVAARKTIDIVLLPPPNDIVLTNANGTGQKAYPYSKIYCEHNNREYRGVGIIINFETSMILDAPVYYPAYKAGLRIGDFIIESPPVTNDGYADFEIIRGYDKLRFHIKVDNICFNDEQANK